MYDYIVVGAGFAGSVLAERIASQLNKKVLVIEKKKHLGGHCYDYKDEHGIIVHRYGPHLFHTNNKEVWDYISQFTEWHYYNHKVLAFVDGQRVPIPFNLNTLHQLFPSHFALRVEEKLLKHFRFNEKVPILELRQVNDDDIRFLADYIYEKVFLNYTRKQWGLNPEDINSEVTNRVPIFIGRDNRYFNDKYQGVPKHGYTKIFEKMLSHPNISLLLGTDFHDIKVINDNRIDLKGFHFSGKIIYTGMIDELFDYAYGELPYRTLNLLFTDIDQEYFQENAVVNYPNNYDFTRITEFKHIHPVSTSYTKILLEYPDTYKKGVSDPFYPMFTNESKSQYNLYADLSKKIENLILVGRLAEYRYYDMDDIIERALVVFKKMVR